MRANDAEGWMVGGCGSAGLSFTPSLFTGLYLTLPAMVLAGVLFLAAARWQPADHTVRTRDPESC